MRPAEPTTLKSEYFTKHNRPLPGDSAVLSCCRRNYLRAKNFLRPVYTHLPAAHLDVAAI